MNYEIHPAAEIFPMMGEADLHELAEDIREKGQREGITLDGDGYVIDGRNRLKACEIAGVEPWFDDTHDFENEAERVDWVLSKNLHRRHLSDTQREAVAARVANLKIGFNQHTGSEGGSIEPPSSNEQAAQKLNVSREGVKRAKSAIKGGCEELVEKLSAGEVSSSLAADFVKAVPDRQEQAEIVKQGLAAIREATKAKPEAVVSIVRDDLNRDVPEPLRQAHGNGTKLISLGRKVDQLKREVLALCDSVGGQFIAKQAIVLAARDMKGAICDGAYWTACPRCDGRGCDRCKDSGFVPRSSKGHLSAADKEVLGL